MKELESLKHLAVALEEKGYTLTVTNKGKPLLRMGKEAKPGLLSFVGPIEVLDLKGILGFLKD